MDTEPVLLAGAVFSLATLGGYLLSLWIGLFGFKEVRTAAGIAAGVVEVAAFAALAGLAAMPAERGRIGGRFLARFRAVIGLNLNGGLWHEVTASG
jgi:hypothetical protein